MQDTLPNLDYCFSCRSDSSAYAEWQEAKARFEALADDPATCPVLLATALTEGIRCAARFGGRVACRRNHPEVIR